MTDNILEVIGLLIDRNLYEEVLKLYDSLDYVRDYFASSGILARWGGSSFYDGYYLRKYADTIEYNESYISQLFDEINQIGDNVPREVEFIKYLSYILISFGGQMLDVGYYYLVQKSLDKFYSDRTKHVLRVLVHTILSKISTRNINGVFTVKIPGPDFTNADTIHHKLIELNLIQWLDSVYDQGEKLTIFSRYAKYYYVSFDGVMNIVKYLWSPSYTSNNAEFLRLINKSLDGVTDTKLKDAIEDAYQHLIKK